MGAIRTAIELQDNFTGMLYHMIDSVNLSLSAMEDLHQTMNAPVDASSIGTARDSINQATIAARELDAAMQGMSAPDLDLAAPSSVSVPIAPVRWQSDGLEVFDSSGIERFESEVQNANDMLETLNRTQSRIAQTAAQADLMPDSAIMDMNSMQNRLQAIQSRMLAIESNPLNMGTDTANAELEQLRGQLDRAVSEQEALNRAVADMDVEAANQAYLRLSQTVSGTERYIRDNVDEQGRFRREIEESTDSAADLKKMIAGTVGAFTGMTGLKKAKGWIDDCTAAFNTQLNAETQLISVLANMLEEDYVAQFELETAADTSGAVNEIKAIQNSVDEVVVPVSVESRALVAAFDQITEKASEIQSRGIYGDEAMIAAAAEFSTYFSDTDAIEMMMDTLSDYAMGMSGGGEVGSQQMVDYATNLGKIMSGAYDAMTKKGFELSDTQKAIIEGAATQEQIVSALGEEYLAMSQDMQAAAAISQVVEESWSGLYESMSNTPEGKIIQMTNAWGDMKEVIGGQLYPYVLLFVDAITGNWGTIQTVLDGITLGLQMMLGFLSWLLEGAFNFAQAVIDNWGWISPVIYGIIGALAVYGAYLAITKGLELASAAAKGVMAVWEGIHAAAIWATTGATWAAATAQTGLNETMLACPIVWIIILIIALIAVIFAVCNAIAKMTGVANSGFGVMCGVINVAIEFFKNLGWSVANIALGIGEAIVALASNIRTAFHNALCSVRAWWYDLLSDSLTVIEKICAALNKLPFVEFDYSGISSMANDYAAKAAEAAGEKWDYASISDAFQKGYSTFETFQEGWAQDAFDAGASWGDDIANKFANKLSELFGGDKSPSAEEYAEEYAKKLAGEMGGGINDIAANTGGAGSGIRDIAANTGKIADGMEITKEDLKYIRDMAEQKYINRFTTANIKVDMTNHNSVSSDMDLDGVVNHLKTKLEEQMAVAAEGVHA